MRLNTPPSALESIARRRALGNKYAAQENLDAPFCDHSLRNRRVPIKPKTKWTGSESGRREKRRCSLAFSQGLGQDQLYKNCTKQDMECLFKSNGRKEKRPRINSSKGCLGYPVLKRVTQRPSASTSARERRYKGRCNHRDDLTDSADVISGITASCSPHIASNWSDELIATKWAHPIDFLFHMVLKSGQPSKSCHFCAGYRHGIQGCGSVEMK